MPCPSFFVPIKDELITGKDRLRYYKVMGS